MRMIKAALSVACFFSFALSASVAQAEECLVPFTGKATTHCPLSVDQGKVKLKLSPAQIKASTAALRKTSDDHITPGLDEGIIADVQALSPNAQPVAGQPAWKMTMLHAYQGEQESGEIDVVNPAIEDGGATLVAGKKYRIYAVVINNSFYVWNGSVIELP
jgi:hypothetical protein